MDPFGGHAHAHDPFGGLGFGLMGGSMSMGGPATGRHGHGGHGGRHGGGLVIRHRRQHPMAMSPFGSLGGFGLGIPGFGMGFGGGMFDDLDSGFGGGGTSVQTFSSFGGMMGGGGGGMNVRSSSTSTRIVNGRKVTTKKVVDNGVETVTTYENDVLKSQTVNGVPAALQAQPGGSPHHRQAPAHRHHQANNQGHQHSARRRQH